MGEGEGSNVRTSFDHAVGALKNSALLLKERGNKMTEKERQQVLIGLGIWKLELKPELERTAKKGELIVGVRARPGLLTDILNRLKKPR